MVKYYKILMTKYIAINEFIQWLFNFALIQFL